MSRPKKQPIIWQPQAKQSEALTRNEFEVLYGGARGGGKTDAGMVWFLYWKDNPLFRGLVIRQNAKDLADWTDRAKRMYQGTGAEFVGQPTEIRFPSGAKVRTGHLKDDQAYTQYMGHEYQKILIEELTQIPDVDRYEQLISSCRSTVPGLDPQVFCTTNPGGLGHVWVKKRWNIEGNPTEPVLTETPRGGRVFIPSRVTDNPALMKADPGYVHMLESISDDNLRKAWLDGDWNNPTIPGLVYQDELRDARLNGRICEIPHDPKYPVFTYWDIGISDMTTIGFFQFIKGSWRLFDYYENSGKGLDHYVIVINAKGYFYGGHYGPHDLANREWSSGDSRMNLAANLGLHFQIVAKMDIADGLNAVRQKFPILWINEKNCKKFLDAISGYRREWDEDKQKFKDVPVHDWTSHAADMLRYWAVSPDPLLPSQQGENFNLYGSTFG